MRITGVDAQTVEVGRRFGESSTVKQADTSTSTLVRVRGNNGNTGIGEMPDIETPGTRKNTLPRFTNLTTT
jgi:L-alanine-DL-glutamate epimerase-like enolase superfamily enzyme